MKNNRTNDNPEQERRKQQGAGADPNRKERDRKGDIRQVTDPQHYDDEYESQADREITRDESKTEKENRPGKS